MTEPQDSNAQPQPTATHRTWDAPLHPLGHCLPDSPHPVLRTPLGYAASHMLQALGLNGQQVHLATLQQPGNSACHDYLAHDADYATRLNLVQQEQDNRWSAFFRANGGPKNEHVVASAVVQIDFDGLTPADYAPKLQALVDAGLPAPTLALCTGSGTSLHVYWRLQQPWPIADGDQQVGNLQKLICRHFDGDLHSTNPARMMRLAGSTYYAKKTGDPVGTAHVLWHDAANPNGYPFDALWQWGQANPLPTRSATPYDPNECTRLVQAHANPTGDTKGAKYNEATRVAGSLERIDPDPYDDWLKVGMALHGAGYPLETWDSWAKGSPKYNGYEGHEQKWAGFGRYQGTPVTIATIVAMAKAADPSWLRPSPGKATQQQLRQAAANALQDALAPTAPPMPPAPPVAAPAPPAAPQTDTPAGALVAQAEALRNSHVHNTPPSDAWPGVLAAAGMLQADRPPAITPLQVGAIVGCAYDCGISRTTAKAEVAAARNACTSQRQQDRQQLQLANPCPPHLQVLGLDPDNRIRLRDNRSGGIHAIGQSKWATEWRSYADDAWMARHYPGPNGTGHDHAACYSAMHRLAQPLGTFGDDDIRKPGIHLEPATGTIVWNTGRGLVVSHPDGTTEQLQAADYTGQHHYIATGRSTLQPGAQPLPDAQGLHLLQLHQAMAWQGANDGLLAFGWAVAAPMGGALPYRPQLAYTAGSSGGKTWARDHVMVPLLGGAAACLSMDSPTPAGLRRQLDGTSLPALVDETENSASAGSKDWEEALRLAYGGGTRIMGQAGGGSTVQRLCTALCTLGINQDTDNTANANRRITVCRAYMTTDAWEALEPQLLDACTVANGQALVLRTFNNLRNTLANVRPMLQALRPTHHDKARDLRNVALLLAFAHSATSTAALDATTALDWLQQVGWAFGAGGEAAEGSNLPEGLRLLQELLALPATLQLQELADGPMVTTHLTVRALLAMAQDGGAMALGPAATNGARARSYLWAKYGLGLCQGDMAGHLLWATGPAGKARQVAMARQERLQQWAQGDDARRHLAALPGVQKTRLRPLAGTLAGYGSSNMPPASGLAIPLALLDDAHDVSETQDTSDAPCDPPLW